MQINQRNNLCQKKKKKIGLSILSTTFSASIQGGTAPPEFTITLAILFKEGASLVVKNVTALPVRPARPVRPTLKKKKKNSPPW